MKKLILLSVLLIVGCSTEPEEIVGCVDSNATNYNANVTASDNSCEYLSFIDYPDFETIYVMIDSEDLGGLENGIWGDCYPIGINEYDTSSEDTSSSTSGSVSITLPDLMPPTPYPNPFDDSTEINVSFYSSGDGKIYIVNQNYDTIKTLLNGNIHAGSYVFIWDGKNDEGIQVEDGYYRVIYENNNYQCFANLLLEWFAG